MAQNNQSGNSGNSGNQKRDSQGQFTSGGRQNASGGGGSRSEAARKGGEAVSKDREHMSEIGRKGGKH
jgi:hypothetical protein